MKIEKLKKAQKLIKDKNQQLENKENDLKLELDKFIENLETPNHCLNQIQHFNYLISRITQRLSVILKNQK